MVRKCPRCDTRETVYKQSSGRQRCAKCGQEVKPKRAKGDRAGIPKARFQPLNGKVNRKCGARPGEPIDADREGLCNDGSECSLDASYHDQETDLLVCGVHRNKLEA